MYTQSCSYSFPSSTTTMGSWQMRQVGKHRSESLALWPFLPQAKQCPLGMSRASETRSGPRKSCGKICPERVRTASWRSRLSGNPTLKTGARAPLPLVTSLKPWGWRLISPSTSRRRSAVMVRGIFRKSIAYGPRGTSIVKLSPITRAEVFETPPCAINKGISSWVWRMNFASSDVVLNTMSKPLVERQIASYHDMSSRFGIKIASQSNAVRMMFWMSKG